LATGEQPASLKEYCRKVTGLSHRNSGQTELGVRYTNIFYIYTVRGKAVTVNKGIGEFLWMGKDF